MIASFAAALGVSALWLETGKGSPDTPGGVKEKNARMVLAYRDEEDLLDLFRRTDDRGRYEIIKFAAREANRVTDSVV